MRHQVRISRRRAVVLATLAALLLGGVGPACAQTGEPIGIILAAGDIVGCFQDEPKYKEVADLIGVEVKVAKVPVAVLALGDLAYRSKKKKKTYADCFKDFEATWGVHKAIIYPVPGNHEYSDDPTKAGIFKTYFGDRLKTLGADFRKKQDDPADGDGLFYSARFPADKPQGWQILGLNMDAPGRSAKRQRDWFALQVNSSTPRCVLAFAHHFFTSSGDHGREMTGMMEGRMARFFKMMHHGAATVLVAGHDHDFEQFDRQDPTGKASKAGVRSFVVGTGGASLYKISKGDDYKLGKQHPSSQMFRDRTRGLLKLVLHADGYTWSFLNVDGEPAIDVPVKKEECNPARAPKP
jgi:hypothetical protein